MVCTTCQGLPLVQQVLQLNLPVLTFMGGR